MINSGSNIVTFLMVFLIQSTRNRDAQAMQLKLNELIRDVSTTRDMMVDLENCSEEELKRIGEEFANIRAKVVSKNKGKADQRTGLPPLPPFDSARQ